MQTSNKCAFRMCLVEILEESTDGSVLMEPLTLRVLKQWDVSKTLTLYFCFLVAEKELWERASSLTHINHLATFRKRILEVERVEVNLAL